MRSHSALLGAALASAIAVLWPARSVQAQDLRIEMKASVDSADPHLLFTANRNVQMHVYETLVSQDRYLKPIPGLAVTWRRVDDLTWDFALRPGVKFHDGAPLRASDVVFSFERARAITGPRTYHTYLKDIASVTASDDATVRIVTDRPSPLLPNNLSTLFIVSAQAAKGLTTTDFNAGRGTVGTGPYRWAGWLPGQQVTLLRNDDYWGGKQPWEKVIVRFVPNDAARAADLLSGGADVIDAVPGSLLPKLKTESNVRVVSDTSIFFLYLTLDQFRDASPFVADLEGRPLARNPLKDPHVRQAISVAINRDGLVDKIMGGAATPAGQVAPPGFAGNDPNLAPPVYDPRKAKQLLTEAGWPQGFQLTLHCLNDRYSGDSQTCQAIGSMLTAIGIRSRIDALPTSIFFRRADAKDGPDFSAAMSIYGSSSGDPSQALVTIAATADPKLNRGVNNRGRYSNPRVDDLIERAQTTFDDADRESLVREATRITVTEGGLIPVYFLNSEWATSRTVRLSPRGDGYTLATSIRPAE